MPISDVSFILPKILTDARLCYPQCEDERQSVYANDRPETSMRCKHSARIDFRGLKLCQAHARVRALAELMGGYTTEEIENGKQGKV